VSAFAHAMPFGAQLQPDGTTRFRLWAPAQERVSVVIEDSGAAFPMQRERNGWFELVSDAARAGSRYRFALQDGMRVPDPASRYQPEDVHGPSVIIDPRAYVSAPSARRAISMACGDGSIGWRGSASPPSS
jgi:1,4-alpha-glucan branching enzyme